MWAVMTKENLSKNGHAIAKYDGGEWREDKTAPAGARETCLSVNSKGHVHFCGFAYPNHIHYKDEFLWGKIDKCTV